MGCCFSNEDAINGQASKTNERTPLLNDGTMTSQSSYPQTISDGTKETSGSLNKSDQQSMLSRILNQTANNVIDVTTVEPHSLEKGEFLERAKQYQQYSNSSSIITSSTPQGSLPPGTAAPQVVLSSEPVSRDDINLVKDFSEQIASALKNFEVSGGEPFVVQFGAT
ncbi:ragulator complex protein LAMTOR1-like [Xenia sp. Carnegie-2017]|uniref:ragulator complex protein LAMTOR1-like n=1 Tax=Xenia sp. Carnegie-2017 TaxID=2897299 RepID=UPI001F04C843|nr:ragulator complex protein LAMTOR1-like [Xenia sp. Carnegie-2017]